MSQRSANLKEELASLKLHDHVCLICETPEERAAVFVNFFIIGMERNERCIYITDTSSIEEIRAHLQASGVDTVAAEAAGRLVILDEGETYGRGGYFDPDRVIDFLTAETATAVAAGYNALRVAGEMSWVLHGYAGSEKLLEYEARLNRDFLPRYPCIAICQYDRWKFDAEIIKGAIITHPLVIHSNRVCSNFYCLPPECVLGEKGAEQQVCHWLERIEQGQEKEEQLQALASQLVLIEERERRRIATDLHDHIGQILAILTIKLEGLRKSYPGSARILDEISDYIGQMIRYVRWLVFELSPPILYLLGLEAAVEWLGEQTQEQHGIKVTFSDDGQPKPVGDETRILLFRAIRELLTNIVRHARAENVSISIKKDGDYIRIDITDDGVGFDVSELYPRPGKAGAGFGLLNICERLAHFGGHFDVKSAPGRGSRFTLIVPLRPEKKNGGEPNKPFGKDTGFFRKYSRT